MMMPEPAGPWPAVAMSRRMAVADYLCRFDLVLRLIAGGTR
ncbi:hypothetical protein P7L78_04970 (plasmid) [Tistrella bauzanensis]|uniref:Uncharacterized protein n=1 Tax=Tistrella arctica TaxID=3133430 RepID=A0ABU9YP99_9PROT